MPALLAASAVRTCLGDGAETFAGLLAGRDGLVALKHVPAQRIGVTGGYHIDDGPDEAPLRASRWLTGCVTRALADSGVDPARQRVVALVGTGLRELRAVERLAVEGTGVPAEALHFGAAVRAAAPGVEVLTLAGACSAGGHALALGQDLIETGAAAAVVVAAADAMTTSMLAMIGRVADEPTDRVRPFDRDRAGVLLGEGAAALVLVPDGHRGPVLGRVLATGLSCDAHHETAPHVDGITRAMTDALTRAGRRSSDVDLVLAHGTGTGLNDPTEATALATVLGTGPLVTAVKGALGHTSGPSALHSLDVALRCLGSGRVPAVAGLRAPIPEASGLRLVTGEPVRARLRTVQVDAFGFGGVNAVTLIGAVR